MQNLCAGVVIGVIILQTMVFAPTIFTTIEPAPAGKLLRALFPKFFRLLMLLGVGTLVALWFDDDASPAQYVMAGLTVTLALICAALVPATTVRWPKADGSAPDMTVPVWSMTRCPASV